MADLEKIPRAAAYAAGDPWTPPDPTVIALHSSDFRDNALVRHNDVGEHADPLVPIGEAIVAWSGAAYSVTAGYGIATGAADVARNAAGNITLTWTGLTFRSADAIGVDIGAGPNDTPIDGYQDGTGTNDTQKTTIQLVDNANAAIDASFSIAIYGSKVT